MWLLHVLADHLRWYGLFEVGLDMLDGSYYRVPIYCNNFDEVHAPNADFSGGD